MDRLSLHRQERKVVDHPRTSTCRKLDDWLRVHRQEGKVTRGPG